MMGGREEVWEEEETDGGRKKLEALLTLCSRFAGVSFESARNSPFLGN